MVAAMFNPFFYEKDPEPILREVFWNPEQPMQTLNGIFTDIRTAWVNRTQGEEPPWDEGMDTTLDTEYFLNHSGAKFCSPLVKYYYNLGAGYVDSDGCLTTLAKIPIADAIFTKYHTNWKRLWDVTAAEYNPIHNYDMTETRTKKGASSEAKVGKTDRTDESTDELEHGLVETVEHGRTSDTMSYKYGINTNTSDPKPSEKDYTEDGGTTVTSDEGTDTTTRELSSVTDSTENTVGATEEEEELHRAGNIGVTTTQKMIEEERRIWVWNYFDQVFSDLDKELALAFHDPCRV